MCNDTPSDSIEPTGTLAPTRNQGVARVTTRVDLSLQRPSTGASRTSAGSRQGAAAGALVTSRRPRECGAGLLSDFAWQAIAQTLGLSPREIQIVRGMFDDCKEAAIATGLGVAPRTVHTHVERLYRKLAVNDRPQLVLRIIREYLRLTASPEGRLPPLCSRYAAGRCQLPNTACCTPDCIFGSMI